MAQKALSRMRQVQFVPAGTDSGTDEVYVNTPRGRRLVQKWL